MTEGKKRGKFVIDEYAHKGHAGWLQGHAFMEGKTISPLGIEVANILGYVGRGLYNAPISIKKIDWTDNYCIQVIWSTDLCSWDRFDLSALWVCCCRRKIRLEIDAAAPGRLRLTFHQRRSREGTVDKRLPDCEEIIRYVDLAWGGGP